MSDQQSGRSGLSVGWLLILAGVGTRILFLSGPSLWLDEANSAHYIQGPVSRLFDHVRSDLHPPLYYILLHYWSFLGRDEWTLRLFSVLANLASGVILFTLVRRMFNLRIAILTLLLFTVSPFQIRYSQEVRMYSLLGLWVVSVLFFVWQYLTDKHQTSLPGYILFSVLGLYTHYHMGVFLIVLNGAVIFRLYQTDRRRLLRWLFAQGVVLTLFLPWLPIFVHQLGGGGITWFPFRPSLPLLVSPLFAFLWGELFLAKIYSLLKPTLLWTKEIGLTVPWMLNLGFLAFLILIGFLLWKKRKKWTRLSWPIQFLLGLVTGTLGLSFTLSFLSNIYGARYLFGASSVFCVVVASLLAALIRFNRRLGLGFTSFVVLIQIFMLIAYYQPSNRREDWRGAIAHMESRSMPGQIAGFHFDEPMGPYLYYSKGSVPALGCLSRGELSPDFLTAVRNRPDGIWLFDYLAELYDPRGKIKQKLVDEGYRPDWHHNFNGVPLTFWKINPDGAP